MIQTHAVLRKLGCRKNHGMDLFLLILNACIERYLLSNSNYSYSHLRKGKSEERQEKRKQSEMERKKRKIDPERRTKERNINRSNIFNYPFYQDFEKISHRC